MIKTFKLFNKSILTIVNPKDEVPVRGLRANIAWVEDTPDMSAWGDSWMEVYDRSSDENKYVVELL